MVDCERKRAVEDVVFVRKPLAVAIPALKAFPWDSEEELVVLGPNELRHCLIMCLDGRFSESGLEQWADAVEARDDIDFDPREIIDLIAEISTPELYGSLTRQRCQELLDQIDSLD